MSTKKFPLDTLVKLSKDISEEINLDGKTYWTEFRKISDSQQRQVYDRAVLLLIELEDMESRSLFRGLLEKTNLPEMMKSWLTADPQILNFILTCLADQQSFEESKNKKNLLGSPYESSITWLTGFMAMMGIESSQNKNITEYWLPYMVASGYLEIDGYEGEISESILWSVLQGKAENIYGVHLNGPPNEGMLSLLKNELILLRKRDKDSFPNEEYDLLIKELEAFDKYQTLRYEVDRGYPVENESLMYFAKLENKRSITNAISNGEEPKLKRFIKEYGKDKGKKSVDHVTPDSAINWLRDSKRRHPLKYLTSVFYPKGVGFFQERTVDAKSSFEFISIPAANKHELEEFIVELKDLSRFN